MINTTPKKFTNNDIQLIINRYKVSTDNEVALVFIVNAFNKLRKQAVIDIVYFNSITKSIIFRTTFNSEPRGFGLKNYWEGAFLNLFKNVKKEEYKKWKKEYK